MAVLLQFNQLSESDAINFDDLQVNTDLKENVLKQTLLVTMALLLICLLSPTPYMSSFSHSLYLLSLQNPA